MNRKLTFIRVFFLLYLVICCLPLASLAADKVVVIPLFGHGKPLKNVVTVAKSGGKFTDPVAAVNFITDASENNPYLVVIAPGVYTLTQTLRMKPWVDITGSGENITKLTGAISNGSCDESSALIMGANYSGIFDLSVRNKGGNDCSIAIYNAEVYFFKLERITAKASGGTENYGIYNEFAEVLIRNTTAVAAMGHKNTGIFNSYSPVTMIQVTATSYGDNLSYNNGIWNLQSNSKMIQVTATARDGLGNCGVRNDLASPNMAQVYVEGYGGANNYGIFNQSSSCSPHIRRSTISGSTYGVMSLDGPGVTKLTQSTLLGGSYVYGNAIVKCIACDDNDRELGEDCK